MTIKDLLKTILKLPAPTGYPRTRIGEAPAPTYSLMVSVEVGLLAIWDQEALRREYGKYGEPYSLNTTFRLIERTESLFREALEGWEWNRRWELPFPLYHLVWPEKEGRRGRVLLGTDLEALAATAMGEARKHYPFQLSRRKERQELLEGILAYLTGLVALQGRKRL